MVVTGLEPGDLLGLSFNNHVIPESRLKKTELKGPGLQRVTLVVDPGWLRFGDNTIAAIVKTARKTFRVEIDRFTLSVVPRP